MAPVGGATILHADLDAFYASVEQLLDPTLRGRPVSVGVARTKHLAKIASQATKPDGLVVVEPGREQEFLRPLPVDLMWGVEQVTSARLANMGIRTIGDLTATQAPMLRRLLGEAA